MRLNWRPYQKSDRPALEAIQKRMNTQLGKDYELPEVDGKGMFLCMVAERNGEVVGAWMCELVGELKFCTLDPQVTVEAQRDWWQPLCVASIHKGIRFIQVPVPKQADPRVGEALEEIQMQPSENVFYIGDLR